ncbi:MAG: YfcE family phosphodiesterase [Desulfobacterales bacterium]|nr:YfcE family phosphodiesterase [Desulfobacterales bacterium]
MERILVTADIHGSLSTWLTVRALLGEKDGLAVAGDLFDTRYGHYGHPDFRPEDIRSDLKQFPHPFYYVYGNCDVSGFCPGYDREKTFHAFGKSVFIHHGHRPVPAGCSADIIIQGHTHLCHLEEKDGTIFINPGSITHPRNQLATYGWIDPSGVRLVDLKTGNPIVAIPFN